VAVRQGKSCDYASKREAPAQEWVPEASFFFQGNLKIIILLVCWSAVVRRIISSMKIHSSFVPKSAYSSFLIETIHQEIIPLLL
jgi:hypothetical protein